MKKEIYHFFDGLLNNLVLGKDAFNNNVLLESVHKFSFGRDAFNNCLGSIHNLMLLLDSFVANLTEEVKLCIL
jgi:hypothetical protein